MKIINNFYAHLLKINRARKLARIKRDNGNKDRFRYSFQFGYTMDLRMNDHIAQRLLLSRGYETEVSTAIFALVRPGMIVLDIGANIGLHTLHLARRVGSCGQVLAFEPNTIAREELLKNIYMNHIKNVKVLEIALWERDGEEVFYFPEDGMEAMGGLQRNSQFKVAYESKVQTARLDTILTQLEVRRIDFIKIDVEGAELRVLRGAGSILDVDWRPPILYESTFANSIAYSYTPNDLFQFLCTKGYEIEKIDNDNYLALPTINL
jgi:FkbM family methyltransferase